MRRKKEMRLVHAAHRLGVPYQVAHNLCLRRKLDGRQDASGRWWVSIESVKRLLKKDMASVASRTAPTEL